MPTELGQDVATPVLFKQMQSNPIYFDLIQGVPAVAIYRL